MRIRLPILVISLLSLLLIPATPIPVYAASTLKWGAYAGWEPAPFADFQTQVGQKMNYVATFVHWGNENAFPQALADMAAKDNQTLVIYWEPMDYNFSPPQADTRFSYDQILAGKYDSYITSFAAAAKQSGVPVILAPFNEMNSDWYPWSVTFNGNTPQKHIDAYRHVQSFFSNASNVKFAWVINNDSVPDTPQNNPLNYYPGDAYVDYVGVDGFNFDNPWQTFNQVFDKSLTSLKAFNKPALILSMACADGAAKANWIQDAALQMTKYPQLTGWIWFNENKEQDWRVWSDPASLAAFKQYLVPTTPIILTTTPTPNPTSTPRPTVIPQPTTTTVPVVSPTNTPYPTSVPTSTPVILPTSTPTPTLAPTQTPVRHQKRIRNQHKSYGGSFVSLFNWR